MPCQMVVMNNNNPNVGINNLVYAELELRKRRRLNQQLIAPTGWQEWTRKLFPKHFKYNPAPFHHDYWNWIESILPGVKPKTFIGIWARGDAKSTNAETGCIRLGSKQVDGKPIRRYALYVSSTQDKADGHVMTIGTMLESKPYASYYSKMSKRAVNKYGSAKGWRHNRLITGTGFAVDAFGLDSGLRGAKIDDARPDLIIIDDVDEKFDKPATTFKKIQVITDTILPSGSDDCAILFIQNVIHPESIASRLIDGRADFMRNRIMSGPYPAVNNLVYEFDEGEQRFIVTHGEPVWEVRTLDDVQSKIDDWGLSAYLREAQHEVEKKDGLWSHIPFQHISYDNLPVFEEVAVWIDPAISSTEHSNSQGISVGGRTTDKKLIGLKWWEGITSPLKAMIMAIKWGYEWGAIHIGVETDQGGDTWESVYKEACKVVKEELEEEWKLFNDDQPVPEFKLPKFTSDKASARDEKTGLSKGNKMERNQRMLTDYEHGKVLHMIGTHTIIEKALNRVPDDPWDLSDSHWWLWYDLIYKRKRVVRVI